MSKEWREYTCEHDHSWELFSDCSDDELAIDTKCPEGHDVMIARRMKPGEYVSCSIVPAAKEFDSVTHKIGLQNRFYIVVESLTSNWKCISNCYYEKDDAIKLSSLFVGLRKRTAERVWKAKKLGSFDLRIDSV